MWLGQVLADCAAISMHWWVGLLLKYPKIVILWECDRENTTGDYFNMTSFPTNDCSR